MVKQIEEGKGSKERRKEQRKEAYLFNMSR